jgi:hypothetical protein
LGIRSGTSLHSAPFFGPASPAAAAFASPVHDKVRIREAFGVREDAVPERRVLDRTAGTAEFPEGFWRFSKADNQKIEIDRLLHATHGFQHSDRIERVGRGMGRR